jgi:zinc transporter ZupT
MIPIFLAITAGFFIYISLADLIPEIYNNKNKGRAYVESAMVLVGIATIYILTTIFSHSH